MDHWFLKNLVLCIAVAIGFIYMLNEERKEESRMARRKPAGQQDHPAPPDESPMTLDDLQPGPVIAHYQGKPIHDWMVSPAGVRYVYTGIENGQVKYEQEKPHG